LLLPASALADTAVIQAESMSWPTGSGELYGPSYSRHDNSNPSVTGYFLWNNQTGTATVTTTKPLTGLSVRLRSEQIGNLCQGSPQVVVKVDGTTRLTASITPSTSYSSPLIDVGAPLASFAVTPGTHTIAVALTNDHDSTTFPCDRNLYVDSVSLVASQLFPDSGWRNAQLANNAPLAGDQSAVAALASQASQFGAWVNDTDSFSVPVYTVPAGQALVPVGVDTRFTGFSSADQAAWNSELGQIPVPSNAQASGPLDGTDDGDTLAKAQGKTVAWSDREIAFYQPASDTLWELYHFVKHNGAWVAMNGGRISNVSQNTGYDDQPWPSGQLHGVAATRIPLLATLPRISEVHAGVIPHAIAIHIPHATGPFGSGPFAAPALATDGDWTGVDAVPEGTRFRLPASVDVSTLPGLTTWGRMVAKAAQDYGLVVTDKDCWPSHGDDCAHGPVTTVVEDPAPTGADPYSAIIGPQGSALANFPWSQLQVVAATP
jgi:hypothetical protein